MCDSAMDCRKQSFQVKLDLLVLESNMACKNINSVLQRSSSLVAYLLKEMDHVQFSRNWPDVMAGLDAFIQPITEFNQLLDKQLCAFPSLETVSLTEPQAPSRNAGVSVSKKNVLGNIMNKQAPNVQNVECSNNIISIESPSVQNSGHLPNNTMSSLVPGVQNPECSSNNSKSTQLQSIQNPECSSNAVSKSLRATQVPTYSSNVVGLQVVRQHSISLGTVLKMAHVNGDSPESFWLRFANGDAILNAKENMLEKIRSSAVKALDICPSRGDCVCAVVNGSALVRGEILNMKNCVSEGVKFVLFDVDKGNTITTDSRNLWKQEPELMAIPAQAVHCRLKGKLGVLPDGAFRDMCTDRLLFVKFCKQLKGRYPYYEVELLSCDPVTGSKINVNKWVTKLTNAHNAISSTSGAGNKETVTPSGDNIAEQKDLGSSRESDQSISVPNSFARSKENGNSHHEIEKSGTSNTDEKNKLFVHTAFNVEVSASTEISHLDTCSSFSDVTIEPNSNSAYVKLYGELSHSISPSEFFLHLGNKKTEASNLSERMLQHYTCNKVSSSKNKRDTMKEVGDYCACLFADVFYRVEILNWLLEDDENVCVQFMDYGWTACVSFKSLQFLHSEFAELPGLAIRCHLSNILPANSQGAIADKWSSDAINYFNDLLQPDVQYAIYVANRWMNDSLDSLAVILVNENDGGSKIINDSLFSLGYAVRVGFEFSSETMEEKDNDLAPDSPDSSADFGNFNPMMEDHNSNRNTYDHDVEDVRFVVSGWKSVDEEQVCPLFRRYGYCRRPLGTCSKKHIKLDQNGVVTDKEIIYQQAFADLKLPCSANFRVLLTAADSLSPLYFALADESIGSGKDVENDETITSLVAHMNEVNNVRKMKRILIPPALGQVVIAKHRDGLWYRAVVVDWVGDWSDVEEVVVQFVDSGEKLPVPEKDLRCIEPKYLHLPFQAQEFTLTNLRLDTLSKVEKQLYLEMLQRMVGMELSATVISWNPELQLRLTFEDADLVSVLEDQVLQAVLTNDEFNMPYQDR